MFKFKFSQINPQHTIPSLEDEGKTFWDSHAINAYLVTKYGKDDSLYPKDPYKKAVVDQRLHFDSGAFFIVGRRIVVSTKYDNEKYDLIIKTLLRDFWRMVVPKPFPKI